MTRHRVPPQVQSAIQNVRKAMEEDRPGWNISIRNEKVIFTTPDGTNLTIGLNPNQESLKKFVREAAAYNLLEGPVRTPAEAEALLKEAEEQARAKAEEENRRRAEYEAAQAAKKAEAAKAAKKAEAATVNGLKTQVKPEAKVAKIPTQPVAKDRSKKVDFPAFDKSLVGTTDYSKFQLADGSFYCIECWGEGSKFTARAPQGLATHRGFRHQMYTGAAATTTTTTQETSRVSLPGDVEDAIDLLRTVLAENLNHPDDTERVSALEAALAEAKQRSEQDLKKADADYQALKKSSDEALEALKSKVHQLTQELSGKDGRQKAETESLMKSFQSLLRDIHKAINEMSPIQAIAKIDELVGPYLKG